MDEIELPQGFELFHKLYIDAMAEVFDTTRDDIHMGKDSTGYKFARAIWEEMPREAKYSFAAKEAVTND